jgi:hypothetical protein
MQHREFSSNPAVPEAGGRGRCPVSKEHGTVVSCLVMGMKGGRNWWTCGNVFPVQIEALVVR